MAKSKTGGTRSYIRGRVGADVYSIGKDAKGAKQQVVRSLAETVSNPQTINQMRGRMIMSTVMQAVSAFKNIIDHSFDGVTQGQPSISEFISRNYALIKADVAAHPSSGNKFALNEYLEKGVIGGAYIVSNGNAVLPSGVSFSGSAIIVASLPSDATIADLKTALGLTSDDYLTFVCIDDKKGFHFTRVQINPALAGSATISDSLSTLFVQEGTNTLTFTYNAGTGGKNNLVAQVTYNQMGSGVIVSKKTETGFEHNTCTLAGADCDGLDADTVLPSYPVGQDPFLNGGDI